MDWKKIIEMLLENRKAIYNLELLDRIAEDFYKSNEDSGPFQYPVPPEPDHQKILLSMLTTVNYVRKVSYDFA